MSKKGKPLGHHRVDPRGKRRFQRKFKETISMNLASIGTLNGASCMAYSNKERKIMVLYFWDIISMEIPSKVFV